MRARRLGRKLNPVPAAAAGAATILALWTLAAGAPVAWFLLGLIAIVALAVVVPALREQRALEPLPIIAAFVLIYIVVRAFQLMLSRDELYSYFGVSGAVKQLLAINNQEIANFVTWRLAEPFEPAVTRAVGTVALFLCVTVLAYRLGVGAWLGRSLGRLGRRRPSGLNVHAMVLGSLVIGLVGQVAVVAHAGGVSATANGMLDQRAGQGGLGLSMVASFAPIGLLLWTVWWKPHDRRSWLLYGIVVLEVAGFYALLGSRGSILDLALALAIAWNFLWRPWRTREILVGALLFVVLAASLLAVRQGTYNRTFTQALTDAPKYLTDPRGILNDSTQFDTLLILTTSVGRGLDAKHGGWLLDAVRANLPGAIDPNKPPPGDIAFRRSIWGNEAGAGRPVTLIGDFFYDFGLPGVAVGAVLLGILARALLGLVGPGPPEGRRFRVAVYALAVVVLYEALGGTYSLTFSLMIRLFVPFAVAVFVLGRLPARLTRSVAARVPASDEPSIRG